MFFYHFTRLAFCLMNVFCVSDSCNQSISMESATVSKAGGLHSSLTNTSTQGHERSQLDIPINPAGNGMSTNKTVSQNQFTRIMNGNDIVGNKDQLTDTNPSISENLGEQSKKGKGDSIFPWCEDYVDCFNDNFLFLPLKKNDHKRIYIKKQSNVQNCETPRKKPVPKICKKIVKWVCGVFIMLVVVYAGMNITSLSLSHVDCRNKWTSSTACKIRKQLNYYLTKVPWL